MSAAKTAREQTQGLAARSRGGLPAPRGSAASDADTLAIADEAWPAGGGRGLLPFVGSDRSHGLGGDDRIARGAGLATVREGPGA